jgi:hypothetical protein
MSRSMKSQRGGKRPGSGRKAGSKNKATRALKEIAREYSEEAIETLVSVMRDPETSAAVKVQAADKLLDRSHGRPTINVEPPEINITPIPWDKLREIREKAIKEAERRHREVVEGRYERLGISREYQSD